MATVNQLGVGLVGSTGSGSFVGTTSPTFVTPTLGVATATSINFGGSTISVCTNGSWAPTFTFGTPGDLSVSYSTQVGNYYRLGNMVTAIGQLVFTPTYTTASGNATVTGFPLAASGINPRGFLGIGGTAYNASCTFSLINLNNASSVAIINMFASGSALNSLTAAVMSSGVAVTLYINLTYNV
jgi:hypothetical protein